MNNCILYPFTELYIPLLITLHVILKNLIFNFLIVVGVI